MVHRDATIYLYADGHAVISRYEKTKRAGSVEFVEIYEKYGPKCQFDGRIVFYSRSGLGQHVKKAKEILATIPSLENGSDATRKAGIMVGSIFLGFGPAEGFRIYDFPGLLSASYTYQPDVIEAYSPHLERWGDARVHRIHPTKTKQPEGA